MTWQEIFVEGWRYDRFANKAWLGPVLAHGSENDRRVLWHILAASKIWATRLQGESLSTMPEVPLTEEAIDAIYDQWDLALGSVEFEQIIGYKNTRGEAATRRVGDIVRHALNHGTYHRGQLRESFGSRGLDFPETDFILYSFERDEGRV